MSDHPPPAGARTGQEIAVIGLSGRFPGAPGPDALWDLLVEGRDGVAEAPADRPWMRELYDGGTRGAGKVATSRGGFLPGLAMFDAAFFGMSPREARRADPQLRLLLESAQEAVEDAALPMGGLAGPGTGVFMGALNADYWLRQVGDLAGLDIYAEMGCTRSALAGRLAYAFGLRGPAQTVDTACSSSLTAVHLACAALRAGECEVAFAGGVNAVLSPYNTVTFAGAGVLSPDGRCKFADAAADGYVRSEAAGVVLLKPLRRALADGDRVRAVILGSAVNNDGFTGAGVAAPSVEGKTEVMRAACAAAGIHPRELDFVEAHGTGTPTGDRAELQALAEVIGERGDGGRCVVGSAKASVGHSEAAAGIVGLIKAVLSLERRTVPRLPFLNDPAPGVDWDHVPLLLPRQNVRLPDTGRLLAAVNSFGATGTNAQVVLTAAPRRQEGPGRESGGDSALLVLSARSRGALRTLAVDYAGRLRAPGGPSVRELCAAAATRRDHYEYRLAVPATTADGMADALDDHLAGQDRPGTAASPEGVGPRPRIVFVFPGQGAQWLGMGRELLALGGPFRDTLERCDTVIREYGGFSLLDALADDDEGWLEDTAKVQPALWAMGTALAAQWRAWGVVPDAVLGHSQGEIPAAHEAGALSLEEAGKVSCLRARLAADHAEPGAMCWVELPREEVPGLLQVLGAEAFVAVVESPSSTVLSGRPEQIERIVDGCEELGISCLAVRASYAAHSPGVDPVQRPLLDALDGLAPHAGTVAFVSTVTGGELPGTALDADYWWRNLREPVRLDSTLRTLLAADSRPVVFLQMSPHPVLTGPLTATGSPALASLRRFRPELRSLQESLATLYAAGVDPDWTAVLGRPTRHVALPHYPWQRSYHWQQADSFPWPPLDDESATGATETRCAPATPRDEPRAQEEPNVMSSAPASTPVPHPLLGDLHDGTVGNDGPEFRLGPIHDATCAFLLDHRVAGRPVLPGAAYLELGIAVASRTGSELRGIHLRELLILDEQRVDEQELRVCIHGSRVTVESRERGAGRWREHADMLLERSAESVGAATVPLGEIQDRCPRWQPGARFYREHEQAGNSWQGAFRGIAELWAGDGEALALMRPVASDGFRFHPAALDSCLQLVAAVMPLDGERGFVLLGADRVRMHRTVAEGELWAHARAGDGLSADITVVDATGVVVAEIDGVRARELGDHGRDATAQEGAPERGTAEHHTGPGTGANASDAAGTEGWSTADELLVRWRPLPAPTGRVTPARWLLLYGGGPLDRALTTALEAAGHTVCVVRPGSRYAAEGGDCFRADPASADDLGRVLREVARGGPPHAVVSLAAPGCAADGRSSVRETQWSAADLCGALLATARALHDAQLTLLPRVFVLTQGAQNARPDDGCPAPWQAALWGLVPALRREVPACPAVLVDVDGEPDAGALAALLAAPPEGEDRLALRGTAALALRLAREPEPERAFAVGSRNGIDGLRLAPVGRPAPGPGQVEIAVSHTGINFHDVLDLVGSLGETADPLPPGYECAGTVARVGPGVTGLAVGQEVMAAAHGGAMRTHVVTDARWAVPRPAALAPAEAAAVPVVYSTAYYALHELARLRRGERVLIHNGTGGLGLAALDIALRAGATVYATAGTEEKRRLLLSLGAKAVADSRTVAFADELRADGDMHVILNTLVGDGVDANFDILAPYGRYIDVALNDALKGRPLPMSHFAPGRTYAHLDWLSWMTHDPDLTGTVLREVAARYERGDLATPRVRVFPTEDARDAFGLMARSGHIGKLVLRRPATAQEPASVRVRPDATYLVTAGVSGIGGLVAEWLAGQGARHLLLTGRSASDADPERAALLARLRAGGAEVTYAAVDVADERAMSRLLQDRDASGLPRVAGVVHSAAVLEPAPLTEMSEDEIDDALRPKVAGGWALHRLFGADADLDFFVVFSSAVSLLSGLRLGSQLGAYAAGNSFLDSLAAHRRAAGLPATVVNWGYWSGTGLAHRLSGRDGHDVRPRGMRAIRPEDAPDLFAQMLRTQGRMLAIPADWQEYATAAPADADAPVLRELLGRAERPAPPRAAARPASWIPDPRPLPPARAGRATKSDGTTPAGSRAPAAAPTGAVPLPGGTSRPDETRPSDAASEPAPALGTKPSSPTAATAASPGAGPLTSGAAPTASLEDWLVGQVARLLDLPEGQVDRNRPPNRLGVDSLMAAELGTLLRRDQGHDLTVPGILKAPSLRALAAELAAKGNRA